MKFRALFKFAPDLENLVGKVVSFTDLEGWKKDGTVLSDKFDSDYYAFLFRIGDKCIGYISLRDKDLRKIKDNLIYIPKNQKGFLFVHGGKNPYNPEGKVDLYYDKFNEFLNKAYENAFKG